MSKMKAFIVAGLLLASPAAAQNAAPALSADGVEIVKEHQKKRAADVAPLAAKKRQLEAEFQALLTPEAYDEAKLVATFKEMRALEGQMFDAVGMTTLSLLKSLSAEDRAVYLKSISKAPPKAASNDQFKPGQGR